MAGQGERGGRVLEKGKDAYIIVGWRITGVELRDANKESAIGFQAMIAKTGEEDVVQRCNCLAMRLVDPQCVHSVEGGRQVGLGRQWLFITTGGEGRSWGVGD